MRKRTVCSICIFILSINLYGCSNSQREVINNGEVIEEEASVCIEEKDEGDSGVYIQREPYAAVFKRKPIETIKDIEFYDEEKKFFDLRSYNLSNIDISPLEENIWYAIFDSKTTWPRELPQGFMPDDYLDFHKDPGLNLRKLHESGVTGKGINMAFIDYSLLVDHVEYGERVKYYEEIHYDSPEAQMHAPAVVSIAAGENTGVAPGADIYFIATANYDYDSSEMELDETWIAKDIDKVIEINKSLPDSDKIRVLSISGGCEPESKGYNEFIEAIERAKRENIFVISLNMIDTYDKFYIHGLDISPMLDKNNTDNFDITQWDDWMEKVSHIDNYKSYYEKKITEDNPSNILLIPIDSKTVASPTGNEDYVFYREGGWSFTMPYIAGVYALACQVKPDISPEEFWSLALETGESRSIELPDKNYDGKIINPLKLINSIKK